MRLIDADVLHKRLQEEIKDLVADEDKECMRYADSLIDTIPTYEAMPVKWMWKTFYELMYDGEKLTDKDKTIVSKLIDRWGEENDGQANH